MNKKTHLKIVSRSEGRGCPEGEPLAGPATVPGAAVTVQQLMLLTQFLKWLPSTKIEGRALIEVRASHKYIAESRILLLQMQFFDV